MIFEYDFFLPAATENRIRQSHVKLVRCSIRLSFHPYHILARVLNVAHDAHYHEIDEIARYQSVSLLLLLATVVLSD